MKRKEYIRLLFFPLTVFHSKSDQVVSENKEVKRIFLTPAGAIIALICFFLPWVDVSCGRMVRSFSGPQIGGIFWLVLLAELAIIVAFFYFRSQKKIEKSKPVTLLASISALSLIIIKCVSLIWGQNPFAKAGSKLINFSIQVGAFGTIGGFIMVLIGSLFLKTEKQKE